MSYLPCGGLRMLVGHSGGYEGLTLAIIRFAQLLASASQFLWSLRSIRTGETFNDSILISGNGRMRVSAVFLATVECGFQPSKNCTVRVLFEKRGVTVH